MVTLTPPFVGNLARIQHLRQFATRVCSVPTSQGEEGTAVLTTPPTVPPQTLGSLHQRASLPRSLQ